MASDRITITPDSTHPEAVKLRQLVSNLTEARNMARHLTATWPHYGTGVSNNFAELQAALGTSTGADAQALRDTVTACGNELSGVIATFTAQLIDRVG